MVGIIGILAALLLAAVSRAQAKGHQVQCLGNLRQLGLGLQNFVAENQAYPSGLSGTRSSLVSRSECTGISRGWPARLLP